MIRMGPFYLGLVHESVIFQHALLMLAEASEDRQAALKAFVVLMGTPKKQDVWGCAAPARGTQRTHLQNPGAARAAMLSTKQLLLRAD